MTDPEEESAPSNDVIEQSTRVPSSTATPYVWDEPVSPEIRQVWAAVRDLINVSQTVQWKSAVDSFTSVDAHLSSSSDAREFWETTAGGVVLVLLQQNPTKIGPHERRCVQDTLSLACAIVATDLGIQLSRRGHCRMLDFLGFIFNKKMPYHTNTPSREVDTTSGCSQHLLGLVKNFRSAAGFQLLNAYLVEYLENERAADGPFPALKAMLPILTMLFDSMVATAAKLDPNAVLFMDGSTIAATLALQEAEEADAFQISQAVIQYLSSLSSDALHNLPQEDLSLTVRALQRIFDRLLASRRSGSIEFYKSCCRLILTLFPSSNIYGGVHLDLMLDALIHHRMPPRSYLCSGAGAAFCNGEYQYKGALTADGSAKPGTEPSYVRITLDDSSVGLGGPSSKTLTLFRCTTLSQQKWWFLSEADEEQPGTDRDIDYYKSKEGENQWPSQGGWVACKNVEADPPKFTPLGVMVPRGEESQSLEYHLAHWMFENDFLGQVFRSCAMEWDDAPLDKLVSYLNLACERYPDVAISFAQSMSKLCAKIRPGSTSAGSSTSFAERIQNEPIGEGPFVSLETITLALILESTGGNATAVLGSRDSRDDVSLAQEVVHHLKSLSNDVLIDIPPEWLSLTLKVLHRTFHRVWRTQRDAAKEFYAFWRGLAWTMISSSSSTFKRSGWDHLNKMIRTAINHSHVPEPTRHEMMIHLARWAIEKEVLKRLVGDPSVGPNVRQSSHIITLLYAACRCDRDISTMFGLYLARRNLQDGEDE